MPGCDDNVAHLSTGWSRPDANPLADIRAVMDRIGSDPFCYPDPAPVSFDQLTYHRVPVDAWLRHPTAEPPMSAETARRCLESRGFTLPPRETPDPLGDGWSRAVQQVDRSRKR